MLSVMANLTNFTLKDCESSIELLHTNLEEVNKKIAEIRKQKEASSMQIEGQQEIESLLKNELGANLLSSQI